MVTENIKIEGKWDYRAAKFRRAIAFLKETDFLKEQPGSVLQIGEGMRAEVQEYETMPADTCRFESHRKYFDIQYVASGEECMGYIRQSDLTPAEPYDAERDLAFYEEPQTAGRVHLRAGDFAIVSPDDGHKPRCIGDAPCLVRKIVVKVPVED